MARNPKTESIEDIRKRQESAAAQLAEADAIAAHSALALVARGDKTLLLTRLGKITVTCEEPEDLEHVKGLFKGTGRAPLALREAS